MVYSILQGLYYWQSIIYVGHAPYPLEIIYEKAWWSCWLVLDLIALSIFDREGQPSVLKLLIKPSKERQDKSKKAELSSQRSHTVSQIRKSHRHSNYIKMVNYQWQTFEFAIFEFLDSAVYLEMSKIASY